MNSLSKRLNPQLPTLRDDFLFPIEQQFNNILNDFFKANSFLDGVKASNGYPKMDIISDDNSLVIKAALPGLEAKDISVEILSDNVLKISGKSVEENKVENGNYLTKELRTSRFSRFINLPEWIEKDPKATIKNGILTLSWEKPKVIEKKTDQRLIAIEQE